MALFPEEEAEEEEEEDWKKKIMIRLPRLFKIQRELRTPTGYAPPRTLTPLQANKRRNAMRRERRARAAKPGTHHLIAALPVDSDVDQLLRDLFWVGLRDRVEPDRILRRIKHEGWIAKWLCPKEAKEFWNIPKRPMHMLLDMGYSHRQEEYAEYRLRVRRIPIVRGNIKTDPVKESQLPKPWLEPGGEGERIWRKYNHYAILAEERRSTGADMKKACKK